MARAKKALFNRSTPVWMITYSDLMTLLLTFFVLLLSMSQIDERRVRDYLISTQGDSALGQGILNPLSKRDTQNSVQPGPMDAGELESIREFIWENKDEDVNLETNRYIAIISIGEDTLFPAGSALISDAGKSILDRLAPQIQNLGYPMLVAGHTSTMRDEVADDYFDARQAVEGTSLSPTWKLSTSRSLAVYEYLKTKKLEGIEIMNEAFGEYRPKVSNNTPVGRKANRRVDLVLDRRNQEGVIRAPREPEEADPDIYEINDFRFNLDVIPAPSNDQLTPVTPGVAGGGN